MPLLTDLENFAAGTYGFSAVKLENLEASEYTLATLVIDVSGSTSSYAQLMEHAVKEVIQALRNSPRADYLLLRIVLFDSNHSEYHGFRPLSQCPTSDYDNFLKPSRRTALFDASINGVEASTNYAQTLAGSHFQSNAILIVLTDGFDNESKHSMASVKKSLDAAIQSEKLESILTILVGVGASPSAPLAQELESFKNTVGFDQFEALEDVNSQGFARLIGFLSGSITSQSQSLGTGGPSTPLTF